MENNTDKIPCGHDNYHVIKMTEKFVGLMAKKYITAIQECLRCGELKKTTIEVENE